MLPHILNYKLFIWLEDYIYHRICLVLQKNKKMIRIRDFSEAIMHLKIGKN